MGKAYHCEYCDRSFRDTIEARRRHLSTAAHQSARLTHDIDQLRVARDRLIADGRLHTVLGPQHWPLLNEVITKPNSCKYHFNSGQSSGASAVSAVSKCMYGEQCHNSHRLSQSEIVHYKTEFLTRLSGQHSSGGSSAPETVQQSVAKARQPTSKRQQKKQIYLNLWLERRFGLEPRSPDLIRRLLCDQ